MNISYRSYLTAGVSVIGAGAIALSTVQPLPESSSVALERATSVAAVDLTASAIDNPITAWVDAFKLASDNLKTINDQKKNPGPALPIINAVANNFKVYLKELPDVGLIAKQILGNIKAAGGAVLDQNLNTEDIPFSMNTNDTQGVTCISLINPNCNTALNLTKYGTTGLLAAVPDFQSLIPLTNILSSPVSGAILGWAGPGLSALAQSITTYQNIIAGIKARDFTAVLNEIINLPAHMFNAVVNGGGHLDLTPIVNLLAPRLGITLPAGTKMGLATGGFLTPAVAMGGGDEGFFGWGGTAWDAISAETTVALSPLPPTTVTVTGIPVGNAATQYGERYAIAKAITLPMPKSAASRTAAAAAVAAPAADTAVDASDAQGNNRGAVAAARAGAAKPAAARVARSR